MLKHFVESEVINEDSGVTMSSRLITEDNLEEMELTRSMSKAVTAEKADKIEELSEYNDQSKDD